LHNELHNSTQTPAFCSENEAGDPTYMTENKEARISSIILENPMLYPLELRAHVLHTSATSGLWVCLLLGTGALG
jgi:hypothetical protein